MNPVISKRYAKALILSASGETELNELAEQLANLASSYAQDDFRNFLENPGFSQEERLALLDKLNLTQTLKSCLKLLILGRRTSILPALYLAYQHELDAKLGRVRAQIATARPLPQEQLEALTQALMDRLKKSVIPKFSVDPELLGGVRAQVGGLIFDTTSKAQFSRLRRTLCN